MAADTYNSLIKRIEKEFSVIDSDIMVDFRKQDKDYDKLCKTLGEMEQESPFIMRVMEDEGAISLSAEEHRALVSFFETALEKDNMERKRLYFRGHTDAFAYLKLIGAFKGVCGKNDTEKF